MTRFLMKFRIADFGLRIAFALASCAYAQGPCHAQRCYVDPFTGRQQCSQSVGNELAASPLDPQPEIRNPQSLSASAHCRITIADGSTGSGTLVRRSESLGLVLTCSHLFDGAGGRIVVSFTNGQRFAAQLIDRDQAHDLAAVMIRRPDAEPVAVSGADPQGVLSACGFGGDGQFHCIRGNVTGEATAHGAMHPSKTIAGAVRPGDSGGGVFNTSGELVGVVWGQRDGQTYATCGRPVREFLQRILGRSMSQPPVVNRPWRTPPGTQSDRHEQVDGLTDIESRLRARIESLERVLKGGTNRKVGFFEGVSFGKLLVGTLGLSGPLAAAVVIASSLAGRRLKKRAAPSSEQARHASLPAPIPIAVDTPPPPQRTVPETHYVSVEKDSFAKAHQWACEQVARKYPGAAEILQAQDSLIKQHLAAQ
jgi:hypothetical protein